MAEAEAPKKNQLVFAMMRFLEQELMRSDMSPDSKEAVEVGIQCLENVYGINCSDPIVKKEYAMPAGLEEIFETGLKITMDNYKPKTVPQEDKDQADKHKVEGNECMKREEYQKAIDEYSKAIKLDDSNAVYFCNRAAAYSKLEDQDKALEDCSQALDIDPKYSKAYGRKGLAHSSKKQFGEAKVCFERALELDPDNESYKTNLEFANQKLEESMNQMPGFPMMPGFPGGPGEAAGALGPFAQFLNNPAIMNMASQMMSNPQIQEMMANMMGNVAGQQGAQEGQEPDFSQLMEMGQQFAQRMSSNNPELVEQLRRARDGAEETQNAEGTNLDPPPPYTEKPKEP